MAPETARALLALSDRVRHLIKHNKDWIVTYDLVFGEWKEFRTKHAWRLEWCDPDTTYQEDVCAFANALFEYTDAMPRTAIAVDDPAARSAVDAMVAAVRHCRHIGVPDSTIGAAFGREMARSTDG